MKSSTNPTNYLPSSIQFLIILGTVCLVFSSCRTGELSRSQAKSLIKASASFNQPATIELSQGPLAGEGKGLLRVNEADETPEQAAKRAIDQYKDRYPSIGLAFHLGLVKPEVSTVESAAPKARFIGTPVFWNLKARYLINEQGEELWKSYNLEPFSGSIPTAQREIIEITGITKQSDTQATVDLKYKWVPNEFGKYLDPKTDQFKSLPDDLRAGLDGQPSRIDGTRRISTLADWNSERSAQMQFQKIDDGWRLVTNRVY